MVHCHNSKGSVPLTTSSFKNLGKYPWYVRLLDIECTRDPRVVCNTSVLTAFALNVYDVYIVINHGVELKAKASPSI